MTIIGFLPMLVSYYLFKKIEPMQTRVVQVVPRHNHGAPLSTMSGDTVTLTASAAARVWRAIGAAAAASHIDFSTRQCRRRCRRHAASASAPRRRPAT